MVLISNDALHVCGFNPFSGPYFRAHLLLEEAEVETERCDGDLWIPGWAATLLRALRIAAHFQGAVELHRERVIDILRCAREEEFRNAVLAILGLMRHLHGDDTEEIPVQRVFAFHAACITHDSASSFPHHESSEAPDNA